MDDREIRREENLKKIEELSKKVALGGKQTKELEIDYEGFDGNHYKGIIEVKRPTIGDYLKIGTEKAKFIQKQVGYDDYGNPLDVDPKFIDSDIKFLAHMLATFKVVVVKCPSWFLKPEELSDFSLLDHIYVRYQAWLNSFRRDDTVTEKEDS